MGNDDMAKRMQGCEHALTPGGRAVDPEDLSVESIKAHDHGIGHLYSRLVRLLACVMTVVPVEGATEVVT